MSVLDDVVASLTSGAGEDRTVDDLIASLSGGKIGSSAADSRTDSNVALLNSVLGEIDGPPPLPESDDEEPVVYAPSSALKEQAASPRPESDYLPPIVQESKSQKSPLDDLLDDIGSNTKTRSPSTTSFAASDINELDSLILLLGGGPPPASAASTATTKPAGKLSVASTTRASPSNTAITREIDAVLNSRIRTAHFSIAKSADLHNYLLIPLEHAKDLLGIVSRGIDACDKKEIVRHTVSIINAVADDISLVKDATVRSALTEKTLAFGIASKGLITAIEGHLRDAFPTLSQRFKLAVAELLQTIRDAASGQTPSTSSGGPAAVPQKTSGPASEPGLQARELILGTPKCAACAKPCTEKYFQVSIEEVYHVSCMNCAVCAAPNAAYKYGSTLLCEKCYQTQVASVVGKQSITCQGCRQPITDRFVELGNNLWHRECFKCTRCGSDLSGGFVDKGSLPFCARCQ